MVGTSGFELPENLLQSAADYLLLHYEPEEAEFLEAAKNEIYDIMEVNALLDHFGEPTLS